MGQASEDPSKQESIQEQSGILGDKRQFCGSDLAHYGPDFMQFLKHKEAHKRAKTEFYAAKDNYEKACKDLTDMEKSMMTIFKEVKDETKVNLSNNTEWSTYKSTKARQRAVWCLGSLIINRWAEYLIRLAKLYYIDC